MVRPKSHDDAELQRLCRERATLRAQRDALLAALETHQANWDRFTKNGTTFGNQEDAYYCLAKQAQNDWKASAKAIAAAKAQE